MQEIKSSNLELNYGQLSSQRLLPVSLITDSFAWNPLPNHDYEIEPIPTPSPLLRPHRSETRLVLLTPLS